MKRMIYVLALSLLAVQANAQSSAAPAVRYDEVSHQVVEVKSKTEVKETSSPSAPAAQSVQLQAAAPTPTVIINNNGASATAAPNAATAAPTTTTAPAAAVSAPVTAQSLGITAQVQEQSTTVIEEKPLVDSRAEQLRKARGEMEVHTESKIVEKLEESRLEGEKNRSDRFDSALGSQPSPAPAPPQVILVPVQSTGPTVAPTNTAPAASASAEVVNANQAIIAPNAQAVVAPVQDSKVGPLVEELDNKSELNAPVVRSELKVETIEKVEKKNESRGYVAGQAGMVNYSDTSNLRANGAGGVKVGFITSSRIVIEGGFLYSNYNIEQQSTYSYSDYPPFQNLDQYNMTAAVKYQILPGKFQPFVGVVGSYTYRKYSSPQNSYSYYNNYNNSGSNDDSATTTAIDVGVTAGIDFEVASNFAIGVDFSYMTNMTNHTDSAYQRTVSGNSYSAASPIEEMNYYTALVSAKLLF